MKNKLKKVISTCLAAIMTVSTMFGATLSAGAAIDAHGRYVPSDGVETNRYYFLMPDDWFNEYTSDAGIYWWDATDAPESWQDMHKAQKGDCNNVFYVDCPKDVTAIIWTNMLDSGNGTDQRGFGQLAKQSVNIPSEYYAPGESDLYPDGLPDGFNNMIYVCTNNTEVVNEFTGLTQMIYAGDWYYYYGNGKYGTTSEMPTEALTTDGGLKEPSNEANINGLTAHVGDTISYTAKLLVDQKLLTYNAVTKYDSCILELVKPLDVQRAFPVDPDLVHDESKDGEVRFNNAKLKGIDFTTEVVFVTLNFKVVAGGQTQIKTIIEEMVSVYDRIYVGGGEKIDDFIFKETAKIIDRTQGTDPTEIPTAEPTTEPTEPASTDPTEPPTTEPTNPVVTDPTEVPTTKPSEAPTTEPTEPTTEPTTAEPTTEPTTTEPTEPPTTEPTTELTEPASTDPTEPPTTEPTNPVVTDPTEAPTSKPTEAPTTDPTETPTTEPVTDSNRIYFEVPDDWTDIKYVFCHIWAVDGSGKWPAWATKAERAELVEGNLYSYDLSKLPTSLDASKGIGYAVIFAAKKTDNTQLHTYNILMSTDCIGDTAYCTGVKFENPEDSEQICIEAAWKNHPKLGAEKKITSTGKIVGKSHVEGGSDAMMLSGYIVAYINDGAKLEKVAGLMEELNLTAEETYNACEQKYNANGDDEKDIKLAKIAQLLNYTPGEIATTTPTDPVATEPTEIPTTEPTETPTTKPTEPSEVPTSEPTEPVNTEPTTEAPTTEDTEPTTETTEPTTVITDKDTNVSVEGDIPEGVELNVESAEAVVENAVAAYNITLEKDGEAVQPDGKVTVKLPVPDGVDGSQCKVYYIDGDSKTDMNAVFVDGFMVFETDHFSVYAVVKTEKASVLLGDVNADGKVNINDATTIQKSAASLVTLTENQKKAADVNGDGKVNVNDVTAIQRYVAGIDTGFKIGE